MQDLVAEYGQYEAVRLRLLSLPSPSSPRFSELIHSTAPLPTSPSYSQAGVDDEEYYEEEEENGGGGGGGEVRFLRRLISQKC